jgi:aerobic-type carbon monoxide dehydrogenase small subunit (CoxS/CutS family)
MSAKLLVNGRLVSVADPDAPLLWFLRDHLGLTGTKYGCGVGVCGACTVHIDGAAERSCTIDVRSLVDRRVTTIEGLSSDGSHPVQEAWLAEDVAQCGYCQPAQIMAAAALLRRKRKPTDADIDAAMRDIICRCGTYQRIRQAIHRAARMVSP